MKNIKIKNKLQNKACTKKSIYFKLALVVFPILAIFVMANSFEFTNNNFSYKHADYGGEEIVKSQNGEYDNFSRFAYFQNKIFKLPQKLALSTNEKVLSAVSGTYKWVEISLSQQKLKAFEDGKLVYDFDISSGLPWTPTVKGDFNIWYKIKWTRMTGGSKENGSYYNLPNVPYTMFFYKDYGMHGAYWHNNFGHPMSHGCVNMRPADAEKLFYWTDPPVAEGKNAVLTASSSIPGTRVIVKD